MTLPLNHERELAVLIAEQLRERYPAASGDLIRTRAKLEAAKDARKSNVIPFPRGWSHPDE